MDITILGAHNTESRSCRLAGLLVDDILAFDAGSIISGLSFEKQLALQAVFLTHQHYDHVRDLPALGMTLYLNKSSLDIYCLPETSEVLSTCFFNGKLCKDFTKQPEDKPVFRFSPVKSGLELEIQNHKIMPVAVPHSVPSVGYNITSSDGATVFYTGDTGAGFATGAAANRPQLLVVEVTAPNRFTYFGSASGHLTPELLEVELTLWRKTSGYIPRVISVHMHSPLQAEIEEELSQVAGRLVVDISPAHEDMLIKL